MWPKDFAEWLQILGLMGAIISFVWGVYQWRDQSSKELKHREAEADRLATTRKIEATKPFLDRQLKLYAEASQVAAIIATTSNREELTKATKRFWELYWGELALVENNAVEQAMIELGKGLKNNLSQSDLQQLSLHLVHACRQSLDRSWGIHAWTSPDEASR